MYEEYDFEIVCELPRPNDDPDNYTDVLFEAGCDDALVGIGRFGWVALCFTRKANSMHEAVLSAIHDVLVAIPDAKSIKAIMYES